jgi:hypothetical protein
MIPNLIIIIGIESLPCAAHGRRPCGFGGCGRGFQDTSLSLLSSLPSLPSLLFYLCLICITLCLISLISPLSPPLSLSLSLSFCLSLALALALSLSLSLSLSSLSLSSLSLSFSLSLSSSFPLTLILFLEIRVSDWHLRFLGHSDSKFHVYNFKACTDLTRKKSHGPVTGPGPGPAGAVFRPGRLAPLGPASPGPLRLPVARPPAAGHRDRASDRHV